MEVLTFVRFGPCQMVLIKDLAVTSEDQSFVYFIQVCRRGRGGVGPVKIGVARDPFDRMAVLQIGNHHTLAMVLTIGPMSDGGAYRLEASLHDKFHDDCLRGEWYGRRRIMSAIRNVEWLASLGRLSLYNVPRSGIHLGRRTKYVPPIDPSPFKEYAAEMRKPDTTCMLTATPAVAE